MDFLLYIQKLQNELKALNLPKEKIHTIITQEYALAETQDSSSLQSFFTLVRLETILTQAMQQNSIFYSVVFQEIVCSSCRINSVSLSQ